MSFGVVNHGGEGVESYVMRPANTPELTRRRQCAVAANA